jgi:hypothetical protein
MGKFKELEDRQKMIAALAKIENKQQYPAEPSCLALAVTKLGKWLSQFIYIRLEPTDQSKK